MADRQALDELVGIVPDFHRTHRVALGVDHPGEPVVGREGDRPGARGGIGGDNDWTPGETGGAGRQAQGKLRLEVSGGLDRTRPRADQESDRAGRQQSDQEPANETRGAG